MNSISVAGNIGRDAETRYMPDGTPVASFSVADSQGRDKPAIWWNCSIFGKRAESLAPYLLKGQPVAVSGSVTEREWTDKDGAKRKSIDVRVSDVSLQGGRRDDTTPTKTNAGVAHMPRKTAAQSAGFDDGLDSDIPF